MLPTVALIGRPNVGKSTLFNRLTQTQNALVADFPGLTRDRQYGEVQLHDKNFLLIDTGGIGVENAEIDALMIKQTKIALEETTNIWLVVDGRAGLMPDDQRLAAQLRKLNKPIVLLINKIDGTNQAATLAEFQALGFKQTYLVSATHGHGIECFLSQLGEEFSTTAATEDFEDKRIKITFVGRPNVGKSTLINRLLGEERVVVCDKPGTTRDSIAIPFEHQEQAFTLIDTAGVRRRSRVDEKIEKFSIVKTLQAIKETQVCLMVIDGALGLTEQDMQLLAFIIESGKALVIAVNKWDNLTDEHKEAIKNELNRRLHFVSFAKMRFISALHGSGVGILFKDIRQAYQSAMQLMSTPKLTRLLEDIVASHPPPLVNTRRIKLRYAHNGGHNPPTIIIHGNQLEALPQSYKRYLNNAFIDALQLKGTPVELVFKVNDNPYKNKRNKLTPRQINKKKRLMKWVKKKKS